MRLLTSFGGALVALALSGNFANAAPLNATAICKLLERHGELSNGSSVYWPGTPQFDAAIFHDSAASTQQSTCVIEPATPRDVGKTLVIIGGSRVPFAVKGGGHAVNPGFSSTLGVHISLEKFNQVVYDAHSVPGAPNGRVTYGAALSWGEVYNALDPFNVTVAGGRIPTVGAAGLTLGGGYSFYSNQHGMTVDNILSFELVKPNGVVENVTARTNPDLFWALKGGGNNFGIVTRFTIRAIPYSRVWGGPAYYFGSLQEMADAYLTFCQNVVDPKAVVLPSFGMLNGTPTAGAMLFYDGPEPPPNMFDAFMNLPNPVFKDVSTRTVGNFLQVAGANPSTGLRNGFGTLTAPAITREYLDAVVAEVQTVAALNPAPAIFNFSPQYFLKSYLKNPARTSDSAYPPKSLRDVGGSPMSAYWTWTNAADDASIRAAMAASAARLQTVVTASTGGGAPLVVYPNYAPAATPLERMYGAQNVARLKPIARRVDPLKIMKLAGGWKFQ